MNSQASALSVYYPAHTHSGTDVVGDAERLSMLGVDNP